MLRTILALGALLVVGVAIYTLFPGAKRSVDTTIDAMERRELEGNWKFYYDREIEKLETKLTEFREQQVRTVAQAIGLERDIEAIGQDLARTEALVENSAATIKAVRADGGETVQLLGRSFNLREAEDQLRTWLSERNKKRAQHDQLSGTLERARAARSQELTVFEKASAQIEALRREKDFMASQLEINEIEKRLRALEQVSTMWLQSESPSDLQEVRSVIENQLLHDEARRRLAKEEGRIETQFGLGEALDRASNRASDAEVERELRALLGDN